MPGEQSEEEVVAGERLPVRADVRLVSGGLDAADSPLAPKHAAMLRYAFDKLEWDPAEFDIYRSVLEYPILHTTVVMRFPLKA